MVIAVATPVIFFVRLYDALTVRDITKTKLTIDYDYQVLAIVTEETITIEGFAPKRGQFNVKHAFAIAAEFKRLGYETMRWKRMLPNGESRTVTRKL